MSTIDRPPAGCDGLSGLERTFRDRVLAPALARRVIADGWHRSFRFRIGGPLWYTPAFAIRPGSSDPALVLVDVRRFLADDPDRDVEAAAIIYPFFRWVVAYPDRGDRWAVHQVTPRGIGVNPIEVPWIQGG